jgi:hypothetical protein
MLDRSRNVPLQICGTEFLVTRGLEVPEPDVIISSMAPVLLRSEQASLIKLHFTPTQFSTLLHLLPKDSEVLRSIELRALGDLQRDGHCPLPIIFYGEKISSAHTALLDGFQIQWDCWKMTGLKYLTIQDPGSLPTLTQILEFLDRLPLLHTLTLAQALPSSSNEETPVAHTKIHLKSLRHLYLTKSPIADYILFLDSIALPPDAAITVNCQEYGLSDGRLARQLALSFRAQAAIDVLNFHIMGGSAYLWFGIVKDVMESTTHGLVFPLENVTATVASQILDSFFSAVETSEVNMVTLRGSGQPFHQEWFQGILRRTQKIDYMEIRDMDDLQPVLAMLTLSLEGNDGNGFLPSFNYLAFTNCTFGITHGFDAMDGLYTFAQGRFSQGFSMETVEFRGCRSIDKQAFRRWQGLEMIFMDDRMIMLDELGVLRSGKMPKWMIE